MPLADYAHWNEDAEYMWWQEEGRHVETADDYYDPDEYLDWNDRDFEDDDPEDEEVI